MKLTARQKYDHRDLDRAEAQLIRIRHALWRDRRKLGDTVAERDGIYAAALAARSERLHRRNSRSKPSDSGLPPREPGSRVQLENSPSRLQKFSKPKTLRPERRKNLVPRYPKQKYRTTIGVKTQPEAESIPRLWVWPGH